MSHSRLYVKVLFLATLPVVSTACRTARIKNPDPIKLTASKDVVRRAILDACDSKSWLVTKESPGELHATRVVRGRHELTVVVKYNDEGVQIRYESSKGLKYKKGFSGKEYLHKNGMVWMNELRWAIHQKLSRARREAETP